MVDDRGLEQLAADFAAGDDLGGSVFDGGVAGFDSELWFGIFVTIGFATVENHGDQAFGFNLGRSGERKNCLHGL